MKKYHRHQRVPAHQAEPGPSRAAATPTLIPASHDPGSAVLITNPRATRKRKRQDTASTSSPGPRKRHKESPTQSKAATIHSTKRREDEHGDPDCDDPGEKAGKDVRRVAVSLQPYLDAVEYPADPKRLGSQFLQEVCDVAQELAPPSAVARLGPPRGQLDADDAGGSLKKSTPLPAAVRTPQPRTRTRRGTSATLRTCPYSEISGCTGRFKRGADVQRHLIFSHLGVRVTCEYNAHPRPAQLSRHDSIARHMSAKTCMGKDLFEKISDKIAQKRGIPAKNSAVQREVGREHARIWMPCYQDPDARTALALLRSKSRVAVLERWLGEYGTVVRCKCPQCTDPPVAREDADTRAVSAEPDASPSPPPEDEEGVNDNDDDDDDEVKQDIYDALIPEDDERADECDAPDLEIPDTASQYALPSKDLQEESVPVPDQLDRDSSLAATPTDEQDDLAATLWDHHAVNEEDAPPGVPEVLCDLEELIDPHYLSGSAYGADAHDSYYDVDDELWTLAENHHDLR